MAFIVYCWYLPFSLSPHFWDSLAIYWPTLPLPQFLLCWFSLIHSNHALLFLFCHLLLTLFTDLANTAWGQSLNTVYAVCADPPNCCVWNPSHLLLGEQSYHSKWNCPSYPPLFLPPRCSLWPPGTLHLRALWWKPIRQIFEECREGTVIPGCQECHTFI